MGAAVFCTDDDILAVRPKMIMMFLASVMVVDQKLNAERSGAAAEVGRPQVPVHIRNWILPF